MATTVLLKLAGFTNDLRYVDIVPLLRDRGLVDERPTAYVCRGFVCQVPAADPDGLRALLGR